MLTGGCYCGQIRYEVTGEPFHESNCHCSICRRTTGAPLVTWFSVKQTEFRFSAGNPACFRSSEKAERTFCPRCGTQLTFQVLRRPDEIDVTVCSLDKPDAVPPREHIHTASKPDWMRICDGLPDYPARRNDD
jgi:hypothetical protein